MAMAPANATRASRTKNKVRAVRRKPCADCRQLDATECSICRAGSRPKRSARRCWSRPSSAPASWPKRLTKDVALALLGNTLPTGAILVVLITILGPISGAHFNPAVSLVFALRRELTPRDGAALCRRANRRRHCRDR